MRVIQPYIKEVLENQDRHGWREIAAVKRYQKDLKNPDLYFNEDEAEQAINIAKVFRHTKDKFAKIPFTLQPFQIFCIANLFGWYWVKNKRRRFRKFYFDVARKNGKTEFAVMIAVILWFFDGVEGAECYFAATKRDQARIGFDTAKIFIKYLKQDSQYIGGKIKIFANSIVVPTTNSKMAAVSADSKTLDGLNPSVALCDELHAHPTNKVVKIFETGQGSRENPMLIMTTTAGYNRNSFCKGYRDMCDAILKGHKEDESLFAMIFAMNEDDDWEDPKNWSKPNPNIGVSLYLEYLESMYKAAKNEGAESEIDFKTKNLNIWTTTNISFIPDDRFMENASEPVINDEMRCFGGLDMSYNDDLTAYVLLFENGSVLPYFFAPEKKIQDRDKTDKVDYLQWYKDGFIEMIPGEVIDNRDIKKRIIDINKQYNVVMNAYDPWDCRQLAIELNEKDLNFVAMANSYKNFTEPIKIINSRFLKKWYKHGGHPVLRWNNENVVLKLGNSGGRMFDKAPQKTTGARIDGMVALAMCQALMLEHKEEEEGMGIVKL